MSAKPDPVEWYAKINDKVYGPATISQLRQWVADGRVNASDLVREGQGRWVLASSVVEFKTEKTPKPPPPPVVSKGTKAASTAPTVSNDVLAAIESTKSKQRSNQAGGSSTPFDWLFDFQFKRYLAPLIIRGLWLGSLIAIVIAIVFLCVVLVLGSTTIVVEKNEWRVLFFSPVFLCCFIGYAIIQAIILRVVLEFLIAIFNIAASLKRIENQGDKSHEPQR